MNFVTCASCDDGPDEASCTYDNDPKHGCKYWPYKIINCTPHDIAIYEPDDGGYIVIPASGIIPRVDTEKYFDRNIKIYGCPIPVMKQKVCNEITDLPDLKQGTLLIVSAMTMSAAPRNRTDLIAPDTGDTAVRDDRGRIIGIRNFISAYHGMGRYY